MQIREHAIYEVGGCSAPPEGGIQKAEKPQRV
jgi:hypothetical protein